MSRPLAVLALVLVAVVALVEGTTSSGATFTATSRNAGSIVTAAADWNPPTVSVRNPGTTIQGTATIVADAADAESGIARTVLQYLAGSTWTTLCTATAAPYSCSWNTRLVADGPYSLRAVATDNAGYSTTSATVTTTVANNLAVILSDPGDVLRGTVPLTATVVNNGLVTYTVVFQYAVSGTTSFSTLCTDATAPYTCSWDTSAKAFSQGESYDLRAVATLATLTVATSAVVADVVVDNIAPTVTMTDPGTPLRGTVTLGATAGDAETEVSQVQLQAQRNGTSGWTTLCTISTEPFTCRYLTSALTDATYAFRAVATDAAGNTTTSGSVTNRVVDNTVSAVAVEDPGAFLSGTVPVTASASSTAGVASVRLEYAAAETTSWVTLCVATTAPYTCSWNTTAVPDGLYDLRATLTDSAGRTTTSATLTARRVDNTPLRGYDVQTTSGGAVAGRLDAGDTLQLTYSEQVELGSIISGWNGTSMPVVLRLRDGALLGGSGTSDTLDVLRTVNGAAVPLGTINLNRDYIKKNKTAQFNATMSAATTTVNGGPATSITITLGSLANGGSLKTQSTASAMVWTPSATVTDLAGRAGSATPVTERGTSDREF